MNSDPFFKNYRKELDVLYKEFGFDRIESVTLRSGKVTEIRKCYYCDEPATQKDHAPSLKFVRDLINAGKVEELYSYHYYVVPACRRCNAALSGKAFTTLRERQFFIVDKFNVFIEHKRAREMSAYIIPLLEFSPGAGDLVTTVLSRMYEYYDTMDASADYKDENASLAERLRAIVPLALACLEKIVRGEIEDTDEDLRKKVAQSFIERASSWYEGVEYKGNSDDWLDDEDWKEIEEYGFEEPR